MSQREAVILMEAAYEHSNASVRVFKACSEPFYYTIGAWQGLVQLRLYSSICTSTICSTEKQHHNRRPEYFRSIIYQWCCNHCWVVTGSSNRSGQIESWYAKWKMLLNVTKCGIMVYGQGEDIATQHFLHRYTSIAALHVLGPANYGRYGFNYKSAKY